MSNDPATWQRCLRGAVLALLAALLALLILMPSALALPEQLPRELQWQTNLDDPEFADPNARRGGRFRGFVTSFPLTLRLVGPDSNSAFAAYLRPLHLGLVGIHPDTLRPIPELATHWAFGEDGQTIFYRLDPEARWSDGEPVTADDYLFTIEFMRSPHIIAPWYNNYYSQVILDVAKYDDHTIGIRGAVARPPEEMLFEYSIRPTPRHFHQLDENWVRDYNWRIEPNTGAYDIGAIRKGRYIEFERKRDWWGDGKRYLHHRFNVDQVRIKVIRDMNVAYNHFVKGELDTFPLILPQFWHGKARGPVYERGHVGRIVFYNDVPQPAQGMFLNERDPILADRDVRVGLAHAMNMEKVIRTVLRGDYERLQTMNEGYGDYSNPDIRARAFDLREADRHFRQAGWSQRGRDGIRVREGRRLSLNVTYSSDSHTPRLVILREQARRAGVELNLRLLDSSSAFKQILEKNHQIAWMGWAGAGLTPRYWEFFHSDNAGRPQTNNITETADPALDELIMAYRGATDRDERIRLARQLETEVHERAVFIPSFKVPYTREAFWRWMRLPAHHGTRTTTVLFEPFGSSGGLFWIDAEQRENLQRSRFLREDAEPLLIIDDTWRSPDP